MKIAYVSIDTENDGPCPTIGNMVELGVSAVDAETGKELFFYTSPVQRRYPAGGDEATMQWLREHGLYERLITNSSLNPPARHVIRDLATLHVQPLVASGYKLVWIARPASYDWMWLWSYWCAFAEPEYRALLPFKCKCISTLFDLWLMQQGIEGDDAKDDAWRMLAQDQPHTHHALDDAREQGTVYFNLMQRFKRAAHTHTSPKRKKK